MANYDCGESSTMMITNGSDEMSSHILFNGVHIYIEPLEALFIPCFGMVTASDATLYAPASFTVIPAPLPKEHYSIAFSFLFGLLVAFAFSCSFARRWF